MEDSAGIEMRSQSILLEKENLDNKCQLIESELPSFMMHFFQHLVDSYEPRSRLAYLREVKRFMDYLYNEHGLETKELISFCNVSIGQIEGYLSSSSNKENGAKALLRKRSIINCLFKKLSNEGLANKEVSEGVGKIPIKAHSFTTIKEPWQDLDKTLLGIKEGLSLTDKEKHYWEKTKHRDYLILELFGRLGMLPQEVYHLDIIDIDLERMCLRLPGKSGEDEWLNFDSNTKRALFLFIENERKPIKNQQDPLLLSLKGLRLSKRQLREITKKYTAAARGKKREDGLSPQKLREINQRKNGIK